MTARDRFIAALRFYWNIACLPTSSVKGKWLKTGMRSSCRENSKGAKFTQDTTICLQDKKSQV